MNTAIESSTRPDSWLRLLVSAITFVLVYIGAVAAQEIFELGVFSGLIVSLLPAASLLFFLLEEVRLIRNLDELQRRIQLEALAVGFPLAMLFLMTMGFLQRVDLLPHALSTIRDVAGMVPLAYFIGLLVARRRYLRSTG